MTFQETLNELVKQTEEIQVVATRCWHFGGYPEDIAIRTGNKSVDIDFHDPIIDGVPFMICGDICCNNARVFLIREIMDYDDISDYYVCLRAIGGVPFSAEVNLGKYEILKKEEIKNEVWKVVKLYLKRYGVL